MKHKIPIIEIAKKLEGFQTVDTVMEILKIKKRTAINYISKLKKLGYVNYYSAGQNKRIYKISPIKPHFNKEGLYEFINKYSKIKVREPYKYIIHNKKLTPELAIIEALKSQNFKLILASLNLFRHIKNWKLLNKIAREHKFQRQIGALYNIAKLFIRVRKIDKRIEKSMLKRKSKRYIYGRIKSKDFQEIGKKWKVEIPFKKEDLMRLKTG